MTATYRSCVLLLAVLVGAILMVGGVALAGDYHSGAALHCTDCHIMHASKDGTSYGTGGPSDPTGYASLLKSASTNALCNACHDGADTTAPDIVASGTAGSPNDTLGISYASVYKNSAGYFQSDYGSAASGVGHDLYATGALTAIQGTWTSAAAGMNCADCHDPHGTTNYRNLLVNPDAGDADTIDIAAGTEVLLREAITVPATGAASATHYDTSAVGFDDANNVVTWCLDCHTNITSNNKHPQNAAISLVEGAHWASGTTGTPGFGTSLGDGTSGIPRVRFGQDGATYAATTTAADTNEVFCLSCHKAHGGKYDSATVWPYYEGGADQTSACDQCHKKGA